MRGGGWRSAKERNKHTDESARRESEGVGWKSGNTEESLVMPRKQKIEANSVCMAGYFKCGSRLAEGEGEKKKRRVIEKREKERRGGGKKKEGGPREKKWKRRKTTQNLNDPLQTP